MTLLDSKIIIEVIENKRPAKNRKEKAIIFQSIKRKKRGKSKENGNNQITQTHRERNRHYKIS